MCEKEVGMEEMERGELGGEKRGRRQEVDDLC